MQLDNNNNKNNNPFEIKYYNTVQKKSRFAIQSNKITKQQSERTKQLTRGKRSTIKHQK